MWGLKKDQHYLFPKTREQSVQMFCWPRREHILFTWAVFFSGFSLGVQPSCTIRPQRLPVIWACICVSVPVTWPLTSARLISPWGLPTHRNASKWIQENKFDEKDCPELHMLKDFTPGPGSSGIMSYTSEREAVRYEQKSSPQDNECLELMDSEGENTTQSWRKNTERSSISGAMNCNFIFCNA